MDSLKLTALRDFAIRHLPRAQKVRTTLTPDHYHMTLYGITAMINGTAPAKEQIAAHLLETALGLLIEWDTAKLSPQQRLFFEHEAVEAATELCELTDATLPWLTDALAKPVRTTLLPAEPAPAPVAPAPPRPLLQPTPTQTTADAAAYLGVAEQSMRSWASKDNGPLRPVHKGKMLGWPTAELIRLGAEGWKPRGGA